ncbi:MAG: hypothetical protein ACJAZC_001225 [Cryomorphaceae bacterium]|jgi:hypothetical protein
MSSFGHVRDMMAWYTANLKIRRFVAAKAQLKELDKAQ